MTEEEEEEEKKNNNNHNNNKKGTRLAERKENDRIKPTETMRSEVSETENNTRCPFSQNPPYPSAERKKIILTIETVECLQR